MGEQLWDSDAIEGILSARAKIVGPSVWAAAQPDPRPVISFAGGLPDIPSLPSDALLRAAHAVSERERKEALEYGGTFGPYPLREAIAARSTRIEGIPVGVENVIISSGAAHGIGASLMEQFDYDAEGNLLTSTFSDYCPITAMNMPDVAHANIESPSPFTFNGAKGMGESAGAPLHAISGAIQDAVWSDGIVITDSFHGAPALFSALAAPNRDRVVRVESR